MVLPAALVPLRHPAFRLLWLANLIGNTGLFVQNTAAGWLMTSLDPSPMMVSLVQAAALLPVFLLALPSGALADILDRRLFLIAAQIWMSAVALLLVTLDIAGVLGPWGLIACTFALGTGLAMSFPAWAATTPELVPRDDLVPAIALNGIGYNLTRAVGPAIGGLLVAVAGTAAAFALNAACLIAMAAALLLWRRERRVSRMPREHFLSAIRAGARFVSAAPPMQAAILRAVAFFLFTSAVWGLLPLLVREQLRLGPDAFGLLLGAMGVGAVAAGFLLPALRARLDRDGVVVAGSLLGAGAMVLLGLATHAAVAGLGMLLYGVAWISTASTLQAAAQMAAPAWVRARAIGIYQMCFFGALALGSALAGWLGEHVGVAWAMLLFSGGGAAAALAVRRWSLMEASPRVAAPEVVLAQPAPAAAELRALLHEGENRVLEVVRYTIPAGRRAEFLMAMAETRRVRLRAGATTWRLYEDVAQPERFAELWVVESWADHLREAARLTETDRAVLATAAAFHAGDVPPEAARYVNVTP
jgi:MFS family permease